MLLLLLSPMSIFGQDSKSMLRKLSLWGLVIFFLAGGAYHFVNPTFYYPLIPDYLPWPVLINYVSGTAEIMLALLLALPKTRRMAGKGIIILLILFIPSHVHFIVIGGCIPDGLCAPMWGAWARLVVVQPLLMLWAWYASRV